MRQRRQEWLETDRKNLDKMSLEKQETKPGAFLDPLRTWFYSECDQKPQGSKVGNCHDQIYIFVKEIIITKTHQKI